MKGRLLHVTSSRLPADEPKYKTLFYRQHKFLNIFSITEPTFPINPLKPELNPICYLLALLGAHHFLHVSRVRVKLLTLR